MPSAATNTKAGKEQAKEIEAAGHHHSSPMEQSHGVPPSSGTESAGNFLPVSRRAQVSIFSEDEETGLAIRAVWTDTAQRHDRGLKTVALARQARKSLPSSGLL